MSTDTIDEQLVKYLADVHSIEEQALAQLRLAPRIAGSSALAGIFRDHLRETEDHERMIRERLGAHGAGHSSVKDLAGRAGGWGMALFARLNPDTPGKLTAHAFSYEHMELAAYEILRRVAERAGDQQTASVARQIAAQEKAMGERLAGAFDDAVEASLREKSADDVGKELVKYLRDAHAIEAQAIQLLQAGPKIAEMEELATVFREHLDQTREHQRLVDERLSAHDSGPSWIESGLMRVGALNIGMFFKLQPDTPAKLAGFAYAFEHLEIAAYELLLRTARRTGDEATAEMAQRILGEERAAAQKIAATWDAAVDTRLSSSTGAQNGQGREGEQG